MSERFGASVTNEPIMNFQMNRNFPRRTGDRLCTDSDQIALASSGSYPGNNLKSIQRCLACLIFHRALSLSLSLWICSFTVCCDPRHPLCWVLGICHEEVVCLCRDCHLFQRWEMENRNIFWSTAGKGAQRWINLLRVLANSHILTVRFQHLELVHVCSMWMGPRHHLGEGSLCVPVTERVNFVAFPPYCSSMSRMHREIQQWCFHFLVFYKKHAFSLFRSSMQGHSVLCARRWECVAPWRQNASFESHFRETQIVFICNFLVQSNHP